MTIDLNADLGEHEPRARTRALMRLVTSANIACGGHAGTPESMEFCVRLAKELGVHIGAHPGFSDSTGFGRKSREVEKEELAMILLQQVSALQAVAGANDARVDHVKLHGALYHAVESRAVLARCYVDTVKHYWPELRIFAFAGGQVESVARRAGLEVWSEAFAERGYLDNATLVRRTHPKALVTDAHEVAERIRRLSMFGEVLSIKGHPVRVHADTICVHADTPNAIRIARIIRHAISGEELLPERE